MNLIYRIYFWLPNFTNYGILGKVIDHLMLKFLKKIFDFFVPNYLLKTQNKVGFGLNTDPRDEQYIVSLTSFPGRINEIWVSLETILRQSFKPDMIILWLAEEQFPDKIVPKSITDLEKRGLTIFYCEDIRSHKKYFYSMLKYPKANIITLDDDLYYDDFVIQNLVNLHHKFPNEICTNRAHEIIIENNKILPYRKWKHNSSNILFPTNCLFQTGGGGTLYPPNSFSKEAFDKDLIKDLCFYADDVWVKFMSFLNHKKIVTNSYYNKDNPSVGKTQIEKLATQNVILGGNDSQINDVIKHFKIDINQLKK